MGERAANPSASADVGEHDGLDRLPTHRAQLVAVLELLGAGVAGHEVAGAAVHDASILGAALADDTGLQAAGGQTGIQAVKALQLWQNFILAGGHATAHRRGGGGLRAG